MVSLAEHLESTNSTVRPIAEAALDVVRSAAPDAEEVPYQGGPPRSRSAMWKLAHYRIGGEYVVGVGVFSSHASLFFYRGRELSDPGHLLEGGGKETRFVRLNAPADARSQHVVRLVNQAFKMSRGTATP